MREFSLPGPQARGVAHAAARQGGDWFERLARAGFAAKGIVYILVGMIAAAAAWGGGSAQGSEGALRTLYDEPLGRVLLAVIAVGLAGYVLWRFVAAFANPENDDIGKRVFAFFSGLAYAGLAFETGRTALSGFGGGNGGGDRAAAHWTGVVMAQPLGVIAVGLAGAFFIGYGVYQMYKGLRADVVHRLDLRAMSSARTDWMVRVGRIGVAARGVVLGLIGLFLVVAALQADPGEARAMGGTLRTLRQQPYGPWLLGLVAAGLIAYGIFQLVKARYRRIARPAMT